MNARIETLLTLPAYQRFLLLLVVLGLLIAGFYFVFYQDQLSQHVQLLKQRDAAAVQLSKNQKIANNFAVYKAEYEKMQVELEAALNELPLEKEIPTLLTTVGQRATDKGLDIIRFKPENEVAKGFYAEVPVSLKLAGSYHQAAAFFDSVSKMERIVNIQGLALGGAKDDDGKTLLSIDCRAITFRFIENPPEETNTKKGGKRK
jgi:type IV pilus assembly protein PilO